MTQARPARQVLTAPARAGLAQRLATALRHRSAEAAPRQPELRPAGDAESLDLSAYVAPASQRMAAALRDHAARACEVSDA